MSAGSPLLPANQFDASGLMKLYCRRWNNDRTHFHSEENVLCRCQSTLVCSASIVRWTVSAHVVLNKRVTCRLPDYDKRLENLGNERTGNKAL